MAPCFVVFDTRGGRFCSQQGILSHHGLVNVPSGNPDRLTCVEPVTAIRMETAMSAPSTNIEKQQRRHKPALIGMAIVALFAAAVFLANTYTAVDPEAGLDESDAVMMEGQN